MLYNVFGYKVYKENDCLFGYDKINNTLVPNEIEAEIVRYAYETAFDESKLMSEYPAEWLVYLTQKNKECEMLEKSGKIKSAPVGNSVKFIKSEHKPIMDIEIWSRVCKKLSQEKIEMSVERI